MPKLPSKKAPAAEVPTLPLALLMCIVLGGGFLGLLVMILPGVGMLAVAFVLLCVFFWLQYLVWGRWIYRYAVRKEQEAEQALKEQP
ncbi:MAG: hypothetical protein RIK87_30330 [Fuerstiella sp.]